LYSTKALNEQNFSYVKSVTKTNIYNLGAIINMNLKKFNIAHNLIDSALKCNNGLFNNSSCNINDLFLLTNKLQIKINESIFNEDVLNESEIINNIKFIDSLSNYFKYNDKESFMQNNYYLNHFYTFSIKYYFWLYHTKPDEKYLKRALFFIGKYKSQSLILDYKIHEKVLVDDNGLNDFMNYFWVLEKFNFTDSIDNNEMPSSHYIKKYKAIKKLNNEWSKISTNLSDSLNGYEFSDKILLSTKLNKIAKLYFYIGSNHYNANTIYGLLVYNGGITNFISHEFKKVSEAVSKLRSDQYEYKNLDTIKKYSFSLYNILLKEILYKIPSGTDIQISSDNILQNLNFESLITDTSNNTNVFLLDSFNISYPLIVDEKFNTTFIRQVHKYKFIGWSDHNTVKRHNTDTLLLPELPETINEVENIRKIFPKKDKYSFVSKLGSFATKNSLIKNSNNVDVLHLALHGEIGTNRLNSKLYFRSKNSKNIDTLYSYELLFSKLKPKIVFLSACNTASGKLHLSEGIFSTARSFKSIGTSMIVASYGEASDKFSRQYFTELYKCMFSSDVVNIDMGSIAKRNLLQRNLNLRETPWLWSNIFIYQ